MPTTANVSTGKPKISGAVYRAAAGTALPTDATTALGTGFQELGFISEDGVTNNNSPDTENVHAWGGAVVLVLQNERPDEWTLTFIEAINPNVLKTVYGDSNVTVDETTGMITVQATSEQTAAAVYVIEMQLKGGAMKRVVIPIGDIKELGEVVYKDDEPIGYEITIAALPDANGVTHKEYIQPATA